jgi:hypothetical protein
MMSGVSLGRGLIAVCCLVAAGCAELPSQLPEESITTAVPAPASSTPAAADDATPEPASFPPIAALAASTEDSIDEPPLAPEPEPTPPPASTGDVAPPAVVAPGASATREAALGLAPSSVASPTAAETLDLSSLVARLRKTRAISLLTKVAVKNESDDLLEQVRAYHTQNGIASLADLRRSYDLLFHKLQSLLREADPPLARDIDRSRAAIWEFLTDPRKFRASPLMAGV